MAIRSLGTEWFGFDGEEFIAPKSFGQSSDPKWIPAYEALFFLLGDFENSKNIQDTGPTSINNSTPIFYELIIYRTIESIYMKLESEIRPTYETHSEHLTKIRGRIDFTKTLVRQHGLLSKHICTFNELKQNDPVLMLLKAGISHMAHKILYKLGEEPRSRLTSKMDRILHILKDTEVSIDPARLSLEVILGMHSNSRAFGLLPEAKILGHFVIGDRLGFETGFSNLTSAGVLLNLNRPFEKLVIDCLTATGRFFKQTKTLNKITTQLGNRIEKSTFKMKPDCRGFVKMEKMHYLIADAKHKIMSNADDDLDNEILFSSKINRNDLYQISTYALTDKTRIRSKSRQKVFALIGLNEESEYEAELVVRLPSIIITYGYKNLKIKRLALNFGSILLKIGEDIKRGEDIQKTKAVVGEMMIQKLYVDE